MTISEHDFLLIICGTILSVALVTWVLCWIVAMRYGQRTGRFLERRDIARRPAVAMVRLPVGVVASHAVLIDPEPGEAEQLAASWSEHQVVNG